MITFKRGLSFLFNSPKPLKIETPLALAANKKHKINSSIAKGTIDEEHIIDLRLELFITISPIFSELILLTLINFTFAFIFFIMLTKPNLVGLQLMFLINNFELGVNKVRAIKGAAEERSPGIFKSKLDKFFCPLNETKLPFFNFLIFIPALTIERIFSVWSLLIFFCSIVVIPGIFNDASKIAVFICAEPTISL